MRSVKALCGQTGVDQILCVKIGAVTY